jgi:SAM-dependent methyltransferase
MSSLTRIVPRGQQLICEVLAPGDLAVDLTAGKGRDTLALAQAVGPTGQVIAFDLQAVALQQTAGLLQKYGLSANFWPAGQFLSRQPGIFLIRACHSTLSQYLDRPAKAILANLGYLPGGDRLLVTQAASTLAALQQSLRSLAPGGRLAVTVYVEHQGGAEEAAAVTELFGTLPGDRWQVLAVHVANCDSAPKLLVAEFCR